jgi:predicted ATPase/class 3 adenylate cyclase
VESTRLSARLDPEEYRDVVRAYQEICAAAIARYDGHVAQYLGDGILAYFGYPMAHEGDAQRAVRAGLGIVEAVARLNPRLVQQHGAELAIRVGIHTGLVVAGEVGAGPTRERLALGEAPNVAARVHGLAEPNQVLVTEETRRLTEGYFTYRRLGERAIAGIAEPVTVHQVLAESAARSRLDVLGVQGLVPFVGRDDELAILREGWQQARAGHGQVLLLRGEAGVGKSRLAHVLAAHAAESPDTWLTPLHCSPYHQDTPLYPVVELLQRFVVQLRREDSPDEQHRKLENWLQQYGISAPAAHQLLGALLSLPARDRDEPLHVTPERQKQRTLEVLREIVLKRAATQPLLLVVEDLHWADPTTLELLEGLTQRAPGNRLLMLLTYRPELAAPWAGWPHSREITLGRLPRTSVLQMMAGVTGGHPFPAELTEHIVARTDGVPLFVEELTRYVLDAGLVRLVNGRYALTAPLAALAIPATLQESLMARLDRLGVAKATAQLAATIGREFSYELLRLVAPVGEAVLARDVEQLVAAGLLYRQSDEVGVSYAFTHALVQDTAYESLLRRTRRDYHLRIARVLSERFPQVAATRPEVLARHFAESGLAAEAIPLWLSAGEQGLQRSANVEAIGHLSRALGLLSQQPESPERFQQELAGQLSTGAAYIATSGFEAPEVKRAFDRARELCRLLGDPPQLFPVLNGLASFYTVAAQHELARGLHVQMLALAEASGQADLVLQANTLTGWGLFYLGELREARAHLERALSLYDPEAHRPLATLYNGEPAMSASGVLAHVLWLLGYPDQALAMSRFSLQRIEGLGHLHSEIMANAVSTYLHDLRREPSVTLERAEATIRLGQEHALARSMQVVIERDAAMAELGLLGPEEAMAQLRADIDEQRRAGLIVCWPYYLGLLAQACGRAGRPSEGLRFLLEALASVHETGECFWEAELVRLQGELALQVEHAGQPRTRVPGVGATPSPAACFRRALRIAKRQGARSLELRAATSLARLWHEQGRSAAGRALLEPLYNWFSDGLDTPDLRAAGALISKLRTRAPGTRPTAAAGTPNRTLAVAAAPSGVKSSSS